MMKMTMYETVFYVKSIPRIVDEYLFMHLDLCMFINHFWTRKSNIYLHYGMILKNG